MRHCLRGANQFVDVEGKSFMSFAGTSNPNQVGSTPQSPTKKHKGIQFAVAAAGAVGCLWLAHRIPIDTHRLPPDFAGRLHQIAPALALYVIGMFCVFWALFLFRGWQRQAEARIAARSGKAVAQTKRWTPLRVFIAVAHIALLSTMFGFRYIQILWPGQAQAILKFCAMAFPVLFLSALFLDHRGQKVQIARRDDAFGRKQEPIAISTPTVIAGTLVLLAAAGWAIFKIAYLAAPAHRSTIVGMGSALLAGAFGFVMHLVQKSKQETGASDAPASGPEGEVVNVSKRKVRVAFAFIVFEALFLSILALPIPRGIKSFVFPGQFVLLIGGAVAVTLIKRKIFVLSKAGQFDKALRLNRIFTKVPGYGNSLEGIILFNAGRYGEARTFLKPLAFTADGKPKLASTELYCYAIATENDGHLSEAEELLKAAVDACPGNDGLKVALATCLLEEEKEAGRACDLLEQAMATARESGSYYGRNADDAHRVARHAWALASAGRRADAERKIQEAIDRGKGLKDYEVAGVDCFTGEAWRMLGERAKSRAAFDEALKLCPQGVIAREAKKGLAKLNGSSGVFSN